MGMKSRKVRADHQGGDSERVQVRVDPDLRAEWQVEADRAAGVKGAPLGTWIRSTVQRGRFATLVAQAKKAVRR